MTGFFTCLLIRAWELKSLFEIKTTNQKPTLMKTLKKIFAAVIVAAAMAAGTGCKKEIPESGYMSVQMSEARTSDGSSPANPTSSLISAVNLDIKSMEVHYANEMQGNSGWVALNTNAGIYDVLMLRNDITATLAGDTKLPA